MSNHRLTSRTNGSAASQNRKNGCSHMPSANSRLSKESWASTKQTISDAPAAFFQLRHMRLPQ